MAINPLSNNDKSTLTLAGIGDIKSALNRLKNNSVPPWLSAQNSYQDGTLPHHSGTLNNQDLIELIAIRGPLHAVDGWSYISRALNAIIGGDPHAARHLAYYGELRGALSILASSGIGIFNRRNIVLEDNNIVHLLAPRPTHEMCWATFAEWAQLASSSDRIVKSLRIAGDPLEASLREFFPSGAPVAAGDLITRWGFDLAQGGEDRNERNWSSYQPTELNQMTTSPADDSAFLQMFWEALRPNEVGIERHFLRLLLEEQAKIYDANLNDFEESYDRINSSVKSIFSFDFMTRASEPNDHQFISYASNTSLPASPYSMICRAALLLKIASGMAEDNLIEAGINPADDFTQWWEQFGIQHGLWAPPHSPERTSDLWADIEVALEDVKNAPVGCRHDWASALSSSAIRICEVERAALWGLFQ